MRRNRLVYIIIFPVLLLYIFVFSILITLSSKKDSDVYIPPDPTQTTEIVINNSSYGYYNNDVFYNIGSLKSSD